MTFLPCVSVTISIFFWWGRSQDQSGWKQRLTWLTFGYYLTHRNSWTGREQEMWLVAVTSGRSTGEKLAHFALLLPSSIIPVNITCVISSCLLNKWHQIPVGKNSIFLFCTILLRAFAFSLSAQSWILLLVFILLFHEFPSAAFPGCCLVWLVFL